MSEQPVVGRIGLVAYLQATAPDLARELTKERLALVNELVALRAEAEAAERRAERLEALLREWYGDNEPDDCSCDSDEVCDGTCLVQRTRATIEQEEIKIDLLRGEEH